jgi:hypothetical protein
MDSISITQKYYNFKNQIIERKQKMIFDGQEMNIKYDYDRFDNLLKERVKMSFNNSTFNVDYVYKNNILQKTTSKSISDSLEFKHVEFYQYDSQKQLIESSLSQLFIDQGNGDTLRNSKQITLYDKNRRPMKSTIKFHNRTDKNSTTKYYYKGDELDRIEEFDGNELLISKESFKYKKDKFENWIERKLFKNDTLNSIIIRKIVYN